MADGVVEQTDLDREVRHLYGSMPGAGASQREVAEWLTRRADLLDGLAARAPGDAVAVVVARAARQAALEAWAAYGAECCSPLTAARDAMRAAGLAW